MTPGNPTDTRSKSPASLPSSATIASSFLGVALCGVLIFCRSVIILPFSSSAAALIPVPPTSTASVVIDLGTAFLVAAAGFAGAGAFAGVGFAAFGGFAGLGFAVVVAFAAAVGVGAVTGFGGATGFGAAGGFATACPFASGSAAGEIFSSSSSFICSLFDESNVRDSPFI